MRRLLVVVTLAGLAGCARVQRVGFDRTDGTFTLCGNAFADELDFGKAARRECPTARLQRCGLRPAAVQTTFGANWGSATSVPVNRECCVFKCD